MMTDEENKMSGETPEKDNDAVWDLMPNEEELAMFRQRYRRRLIIHLCTAFVAALLFGIIVYSGIFEQPSNKMEPQFVKVSTEPVAEKTEKTAAEPLERIRKAMAEATEKNDLMTLQKELADLLKGELKDDPAALKLHFELTEKIQLAEPENE